MLLKTAGWQWGQTLPSAVNSSTPDTSVNKVEGVFKSPSLASNKLSPDTSRKFGVGQAAMKKMLPPSARKTQTALLSSVKNVAAAQSKPIGAPSPPHTGLPQTSPVASTMKGISSKPPKAPNVAGGKVAASIKTDTQPVVASTGALLAKAISGSNKAMTGWTSPGSFSS